LYLKTGYNITRESYNSSRISGATADAVLTKDFNERWAAYVGYHYKSKNRQNSLFKFNTDNYSRKLESGFSYRIDDKNRVAVGAKYDMDNRKLRDVDYYWYHDMHCTQFILRYRSMSNTWNVRWEFTPW
jgi:LPS-assembly protein